MDSATKSCHKGTFSRCLAVCALLLGSGWVSYAQAPKGGVAAAVPIVDRLSARPQVAAHQGGLHLDANTLKRFEKAREAGADIIEMDLRETSDGVPVVHHDETIGRIIGEGPAINSLTAEELRAYHAGGGQPIPTFAEVLAWADGRVVINAEFKTPEVIAAAVALVQEHDAYEWVYFQCKDDRARYETARALDARVARLFKPMSDDDLDWALGLNDPRLVVIEIDPSMRRPEVIQRAHDGGKLTSYNSWRFSLTQELFRAVVPKVYELGIDIAVTNRPASAVRQRDAWVAEHGR
ncbi:MAG: hypothetical protein GC168_03435 [Candidatus Hydrogenedens sp.]|nr:hypothetical protein [Candidatus Hydrogenedens sp.]